MTENQQKLEVSWIRLIGWGVGLLLLVYTVLNGRIDKIEQQKLDKAVFEEHQARIAAMGADLSRVRDLLEQHAMHFKAQR